MPSVVKNLSLLRNHPFVKKISNSLRNEKYFILFSCLFFLSCLFLARLWIVGDGVSYYAWLRSLIFDFNWNFYNEFTLFNITNSAALRDPIELTRLVPNTFSVGPALLWSIPYSLFNAFNTMFFSSSPTGYEFRYLALTSTLSITVGFIGFFLLHKLLAPFAEKKERFLILLSIWLATPLLQYLYDEMNYSHIFSFSFVTLFLLYWISYRKHLKEKGTILLGLLGGLMTLMRWQEAFFLLLPLIDWGYSFFKVKNKTIKKKYFQHILMFLIAAFVAFIPQIIAWKVVFGRWILIPQGIGFLKYAALITENQFMLFLFSARHGLFSWHPILFIGFIGLILFMKKQKRLGGLLLFALLGQIIINASIEDWWAGHSFGARRMINCLPLFAIGMATFLKKITSHKKLFYPFLGLIVFLLHRKYALLDTIQNNTPSWRRSHYHTSHSKYSPNAIFIKRHSLAKLLWRIYSDSPFHKCSSYPMLV